MAVLRIRIMHILGAITLLIATNATANEATRAAISGAMVQIEGVLVDGAADQFRNTLAEGDPNLAVALGHAFFVKRNFDAAGWMFGAQALSNPEHAAALSNYGAMVAEIYADAPDVFDADFLMSGVLAAQDATALENDNSAFQNNLSRISLDAAQVLGNDVVLLEQAVEAALAATSNGEAENVLYLTNLARALAATGRDDEAARIMAIAHGLDPANLSFLSANADMGQSVGYSNAYAASPRQCDVNYRCQEICPKSIIGGLMSVTCEIENSSAQMACGAGQPYAKSYNCKEDLPEYGILIPGLNSGFSIAVPGFSMHVLVDGQGNVDVRGEAGISVGPIGGYVRADGHYSPSNGVAVDNMGGGVRINLINGGRAGEIASGLGHPPAHIELESLNGEPPVIALETYNAPVITN